ncbi:hypothetical protein SDC9_197901 [bioreactor metagenome]|uniref:Uncharacterized protein n=1 Tax=bioreactor metagenome TaxID=1076179 RepID=A0A645IG66_9ZZZZ
MVGDGYIGSDLVDLEIVEHAERMVERIDCALRQRGDDLAPCHRGGIGAHGLPNSDIKVVL